MKGEIIMSKEKVRWVTVASAATRDDLELVLNGNTNMTGVWISKFKADDVVSIETSMKNFLSSNHFGKWSIKEKNNWYCELPVYDVVDERGFCSFDGCVRNHNGRWQFGYWRCGNVFMKNCPPTYRLSRGSGKSFV